MLPTPASYSVDKLIMRFYITQYQWELITLKLKELDPEGFYHFIDTYGLDIGVIFDSTTSRVIIGYRYTSLNQFGIAIEALDMFTRDYLPVRECIINFNPNITPYLLL